MYDPAPRTPEASTPPTIRLTRDEHNRLTDGRNTYWKDGGRVRWSRHASRGDWADDGLGVAGHGAALTLRGAVTMAHECEALRVEARANR